MTDPAHFENTWIVRQWRWFLRNPDRNHRLTTIPVAAVAALVGPRHPDVGLIATALSVGPPRKSLRLHIAAGQTTVRCAVARASHQAHPEPRLKVVVLDLSIPIRQPRRQTDHPEQRRRDDEAKAEYLIELARFASARKETLDGAIRRVQAGRSLFERDD